MKIDTKQSHPLIQTHRTLGAFTPLALDEILRRLLPAGWNMRVVVAVQECLLPTRPWCVPTTPNSNATTFRRDKKKWMFTVGKASAEIPRKDEGYSARWEMSVRIDIRVWLLPSPMNVIWSFRSWSFCKTFRYQSFWRSCIWSTYFWSTKNAYVRNNGSDLVWREGLIPFDPSDKDIGGFSSSRIRWLFDGRSSIASIWDKKWPKSEFS